MPSYSEFCCDAAAAVAGDGCRTATGDSGGRCRRAAEAAPGTGARCALPPRPSGVPPRCRGPPTLRSSSCRLRGRAAAVADDDDVAAAAAGGGDGGTAGAGCYDGCCGGDG